MSDNETMFFESTRRVVEVPFKHGTARAENIENDMGQVTTRVEVTFAFDKRLRWGAAKKATAKAMHELENFIAQRRTQRCER